MNIFKTVRSDFSYEDLLQVDGAFQVSHINYGKSPSFNGTDSVDMNLDSLKSSLSSEEKIIDVFGNIYSFDGTEKHFTADERVLLWKSYWMEYMNAFERLIIQLPSSIVTINIGRQAIELGFKYLLLIRTGNIERTHDLAKLSSLLFLEYNISEKYMENVKFFCEMYYRFIEGENVEYFRFPEYGKQTFFAGKRLDIHWLSYNFILILLKLIHFADLENEM